MKTDNIDTLRGNMRKAYNRKRLLKRLAFDAIIALVGAALVVAPFALYVWGCSNEKIHIIYSPNRGNLYG
jgi:hypothetical protein